MSLGDSASAQLQSVFVSTPHKRSTEQRSSHSTPRRDIKLTCRRTFLPFPLPIIVHRPRRRSGSGGTTIEKPILIYPLCPERFHVAANSSSSTRTYGNSRFRCWLSNAPARLALRVPPPNLADAVHLWYTASRKRSQSLLKLREHPPPVTHTLKSYSVQPTPMTSPSSPTPYTSQSVTAIISVASDATEEPTTRLFDHSFHKKAALTTEEG